MRKIHDQDIQDLKNNPQDHILISSKSLRTSEVRERMEAAAGLLVIANALQNWNDIPGITPVEYGVIFQLIHCLHNGKEFKNLPGYLQLLRDIETIDNALNKLGAMTDELYQQTDEVRNIAYGVATKDVDSLMELDPDNYDEYGEKLWEVGMDFAKDHSKTVDEFREAIDKVIIEYMRPVWGKIKDDAPVQVSSLAYRFEPKDNIRKQVGAVREDKSKMKGKL